MPSTFNLVVFRCAVALSAVAIMSFTSSIQAQDDSKGSQDEASHADELKAPVRLEADGRPIDIGEKSSIAHAGPCIADVDNDGDSDLLVGDFPGFFWYFENVGTDKQPKYESRGKLQAGDEDAKTPVY